MAAELLVGGPDENGMDLKLYPGSAQKGTVCQLHG